MLANPLRWLRGALRRTRRDERGMTLVELLVGVGGGTVVLLGAYAAMQVALQAQTRTEDRIDATSRGRLGMERITRDIRSQQCLPGATAGENSPAMIIATDRALEFYTSVTQARDSAQLIERRRLEWTPVNANTRGFGDGGVQVGDIVETVWTQRENVGPPYEFPSTPTQRSVVAQDVQQQTPTTPIFQYFGYDPGDIGRPSNTAMPLVAAATDARLNPQGRPRVSDENVPAIVMIEVRFAARARRGNVARSLTVPFTNRVAVRTADPYDPQRRPFCL